jgi:hypothetical protein
MKMAGNENTQWLFTRLLIERESEDAMQTENGVGGIDWDVDLLRYVP